MSSLEEIRKARLAKLQILKDRGVDPYPAKVSARTEIAKILKDFDVLEGKGEVTVVGRVLAIRGQGSLSFFTFDDGTGHFQGLLKKDDVDEKIFSAFSEIVDIGDFLEARGTLFVTKRGEKTLLVKDWKIISKSLRPLPEKWHGIKDPEERYRLRYLDILFDGELRKVFERKSRFWDVTRKFLKDRGFLEVETPTLEVTTGGAEARPFKTHHNDYDLDLCLRISIGELWQKRLMAAGFPKTFEIGRAYRNEGTSADHVQEFTNMEFYAAYSDAEEGMEFVKTMYRHIAKEVYGKTKFSSRGFEFDLADEWEKIDYVSKIKELTEVDVASATPEAMKKRLTELGVEYVGETRERLVDTLWKYCRKKIAGPAFLVGHPVLVAPLAKLDPKDPNKVLMFQPLLAGSEAGRGYSELNDPIDQKTRFEVQQKLIESGDEEAMMPDFEFVEMLEYGMPPTCGYGFGERVFALFEDKPIRETQLFPLLRPKRE